MPPCRLKRRERERENKNTLRSVFRHIHCRATHKKKKNKKGSHSQQTKQNEEPFNVCSYDGMFICRKNG